VSDALIRGAALMMTVWLLPYLAVVIHKPPRGRRPEALAAARSVRPRALAAAALLWAIVEGGRLL
jgi:hypothetical protein